MSTRPEPTGAPRRNRVRARLAIGTSLSALGVAALVAVGAAALSAWRSADVEVETQAGAARVGDEVAVVVVAADGTKAADAARADALRWTLVALGIALVPAAVVGWFTSGRLLGAVDRALADIESKDAARTRRLHEVAHELRTPLAVVGVNLELAAGRVAADDDQLLGWIDAARRASERMGHTVGDLAGHGGLANDPDAGPLDLTAEADALVGEHLGPARHRGVDITTRGLDQLWVPSADQKSVHTTLGNLLDNAVRLAPRGSSIIVDWGRVDEWAWVSVSDEGPGLAARHHARVFERGWSGRDDGGPSPDDAPRGLGLAIARQLVEANRGVLTIESRHGVGSAFAIWLPLSPAAKRTDVVGRDGVHPVISPWRRPVAAA